MGDVLYSCDLKACDPCPHTECKHTSDISHAVNFEMVGNNHWFEKERPMSKDILIVQVYKNLTYFDLKRFQEDLCKMKESGVVVLPSWSELIEVVDDGTDIKVEEKN